MKKSKTKTQAVIGCQSRDQAVEAIKRIGDLSREKERIAAAMNDQVAQLQKQADEQVAPLTAEIEQLEEAVKVWATAHHDALTDGGKVKFADLTTGIIRWRNNPPKCSITGVDAVLALLENNPIFERFIRVKKEVNKDAVLNEPEFFATHPVAGLKIVQGKEFFVIEPHNQELA